MMVKEVQVNGAQAVRLGPACGAALWLAPLRGVTIRAFREAFAEPIREAGFVGAVAPFIPANPGIRVNDRMLADLQPFPSTVLLAPREQPLQVGSCGEGRFGSYRSAREGASSTARSPSEPTKNQEPGTKNPHPFTLIPQVITKDPPSMRELLKGFKDRGFDRADLNSGCPFPMIRRRGRGSGLFKTPDVLERLLEAGCDEMGPGRFSLKIRLGMERPDELRALMPMINRYPLAVLTVHARTAKQMYDGVCDHARFAEIAALSANPIMYNGDVPFPAVGSESRPYHASGRDRSPSGLPSLHTGGDRSPSGPPSLMIGRSFIRALGARDDAADLLRRYIKISQAELNGDRPVLGRMKELLSYWGDDPHWRRLWPAIKICRTVDELLCVVR